MNITHTVDGVLVTVSEAQKAVRYVFKNRKSIKSKEQLSVVFDDYIRKLRVAGKGGNYIA